jgi:hypothetical protein
VGVVRSYLVEIFLARSGADGREECDRRARSAAEELTRNGSRVLFVGSTYVPEDEMCFFTFDAASRGVVERAAKLAGLEAMRVVEVVSSGKEQP